MTTAGIAPGDILSGKYRIIRSLGEGGMAVVYEGEHLRLRMRVAIKVLRDEYALVPATVERFEREGRALSALRSPNFVRVHDVDTTSSGTSYLVMDLLDGADLESELLRRGPLPVGTAVRYIQQACNAMREAHAQGIVHRDLKPTNLFLVREGGAEIVKVLDFGIATDAPSTASARVTRADSVMGTPLYMSPEQFRSTRDVDARTDIWALGATLYELLTGAPPFTGTATTIGVAIVTEDPPPIETLRPEVPPALRQVIGRALEKDRERRFSSMTELAEALAPFADAGDASDAPDASERASVEANVRRGIDAFATTVAEAPDTRDDDGPPRSAAGTVPSTLEDRPPRRPWSAARVALTSVAVVASALLVAVQVYTRRPPVRESAPAVAMATATPSAFVATPAPTPAPLTVPSALDVQPVAASSAPDSGVEGPMRTGKRAAGMSPKAAPKGDRNPLYFGAGHP